MYLITDTFGTHQTAWKWSTALEWLAVCSPDAQIAHRLTGVILAKRTFTRV